jgi:hypothetical protein
MSQRRPAHVMHQLLVLEVYGSYTGSSQSCGNWNGWQTLSSPIIKGKLINSDLEMAAILLQYLIMEQVQPMNRCHTAIW